MKRILLSIASAVAALVLIPAAASAAPKPKEHTQISGQVTNSANVGVSGATVTIVCNGHTKHTTTSHSGFYSKNFSDVQCDEGDTVTVSATKGADSGSNGATVEDGGAHLDIAVVDVTVVPEFGLATAAGAGLIGGAGFLAVRRRQTSGHQA